MAAAREIQSSILPAETPQVPQLKIAARYSPMASVAGDFYDFAFLDSKAVGILIADVAGHGVPAALIASMVKVAFASQQPHAQDSLARPFRLEPDLLQRSSEASTSRPRMSSLTRFMLGGVRRQPGILR